jgi:hypothetical protein
MGAYGVALTRGKLKVPSTYNALRRDIRDFTFREAR